MKRLISRYYHALAIGGGRVAELGGDLETYQQKLLQFKRNATAYFDPLTKEKTLNERCLQHKTAPLFFTLKK